jgi:uncharacterized protein (TIGR02466 family)
MTPEQDEPQPAPLDQLHYFATPVYITQQPQFLDVVKAIAADSITQVHGDKKPDKIHPVRMSGNMLEDERIAPFAEFIANTAWNVLASQGFAMEGFSTSFTELWCQEHFQTSSMDYHAHAGGNFIVGFYFLDVPEGAPPVVIHDPRPGRVMLSLPEANPSQATLASTMINFKPQPGMMMFAPAWLAHSFGRNASKKPFRFVHFNLTVQQTAPAVCPVSSAEVI